MRKFLWQAALVAVIVMFTGVGGCTTLSGGRAGGAFCEVAKPQRPSSAEILAMTPERRKEVLAHNRLGAAQCGWRP